MGIHGEGWGENARGLMKKGCLTLSAIAEHFWPRGIGNRRTNYRQSPNIFQTSDGEFLASNSYEMSVSGISYKCISKHIC
jgi:hypothetical protein